MYDLAVIGGGPGGYTAADEAAKAGLSVILFEKDLLGGTCLNRGCIPTKALLHGSELYRTALHAQEWGLRLEASEYDFRVMHEKKDSVVTFLRQGIEKLMKSDKVTVIRSSAKILSCGSENVRIEADGEIYEAKDVIIAAGSVPSLPPIPGLNLPGVCTSNEILEGSGRYYSSLIIIGGGVIGCECASIYLNLGSQITVLEAMEHLLPPMDREFGQRLALLLKKQGASVNLSCRVTSVEGTPGHMIVRYTDKAGKECSAEAEGVLVATGRKAASDGLFTDMIPQMERGAILTDESGLSSIPHVYVIGDARARTMQLAHTAEAQARNAVAAILGLPLPVDMNTVPACVYTQPEIASVGLTEAEAKAQGIPCRVKKVLTGSNGKCVIESGESGFIKAVFDKETDRILGAQLFCPRATDLVGEFALAVSLGLTARQVASVIHPHPTVSEMAAEVCRD